MRSPSILPANSAIKRPLDRLQSADLISAWPLLHGNSLPPVRRRAFRPPQIPPPHKVRKTPVKWQTTAGPARRWRRVVGIAGISRASSSMVKITGRPACASTAANVAGQLGILYLKRFFHRQTQGSTAASGLHANSKEALHPQQPRKLPSPNRNGHPKRGEPKPARIPVWSRCWPISLRSISLVSASEAQTFMG